MYSLSKLAGFLLLCTSAAVLAESPYAINGLHTDLSLASAVEQAEELGGKCAVKQARPGKEGKTVQCSYSHCSEPGSAGGCKEAGAASSGPMFASVPISSIALVAPDDAAPLTRIVMVYDGDTDVMAQSLLETFGPTVAGGAPTDKKSWSRARRWSWVQGQYRLGLLDSPQLLILATDPALLPGVGAEPEAAP